VVDMPALPEVPEVAPQSTEPAADLDLDLDLHLDLDLDIGSAPEPAAPADNLINFDMSDFELPTKDQPK
ncbi:MAG: hypothetical protein HXX19_15200, partial [Rhodoferax sp.]|nr:hypothetical protein [Rhodoferax sp.]